MNIIFLKKINLKKATGQDIFYECQEWGEFEFETSVVAREWGKKR